MIQNKFIKYGLMFLVYALLVGVCFAVMMSGLRKSDIVNCKKELGMSKTYSNYFITELDWKICNEYGIEVDKKFVLAK